MTTAFESVEYVQKSCLFCGDDKNIKELYPQTFSKEDLTPSVFSARRATENFHYSMVRCVPCGIVFSRRILPDDVLSQLYSESAVTFNKHMSSLRQDYWGPLAKHINLINKGSALDIGCSNGFFLEELKDQGFAKVAGFEPSLEAKKQAHPSIRESIISEFFNGATDHFNEKFDLMTSFHTLDHVSDPMKFVRQCKTSIKPGGLLYFVTHDVEALQAKILKDKSPIIDIEHIYLFSQKTLGRLMTENGFKIVDIGNLTNSYPLPYFVHMLPLPKWMKPVLDKGIHGLGLSRVAPRLPLGNIFVIGQAPAA